MIDETDRQILQLLHDDARMPLAEIARRCGLALTTVHRRFRRLQETGVIEGFTLRVDPAAIGLAVTAFAHIRQRYKTAMEDCFDELMAFPEVEEIHSVTGDFDLVVKLRARSNADVLELLKRIYPIAGVTRSATQICLVTRLERPTRIDAGGGGNEGRRAP